MLINSNMAYDISKHIRQNIYLFSLFENVYLFGSILDDSKFSNDIDLLLIYSSYSNRILDDLNQISSVLETMYRLPVDFTVLSIEEEKDIEFLRRIYPKYIKLK
jgi:predicted nucleotidyltransferase